MEYHPDLSLPPYPMIGFGGIAEGCKFHHTGGATSALNSNEFIGQGCFNDFVHFAHQGHCPADFSCWGPRVEPVQQIHPAGLGFSHSSSVNHGPCVPNAAFENPINGLRSCQHGVVGGLIKNAVNAEGYVDGNHQQEAAASSSLDWNGIQDQLVPASFNVAQNTALGQAHFQIPTISHSYGSSMEVHRPEMSDGDATGYRDFVPHNGGSTDSRCLTIDNGGSVNPSLPQIPSPSTGSSNGTNGAAQGLSPITFRCTHVPNCTKTFKRSSDLAHHIANVHGINQTLHLCPIQGCPKSQRAGYSRADKVTEHLWKKHSALGYVKRA